ncbi:MULTISPECIES: hypothetical protein [Sutcliffiella]|uniref:hypothetical protein n=1 Tax=Sutcliffiella TaxID=2837511 RepID=UPI0022DCE660|nr:MULTISPECIES: hypothetical protein [Sutcliffiella]MED4016973.1 hypothetical protein [Sutcliffiella cohnii]WBL16338.1 hypothetical protein O1A01_06815 [Sutcliffiella sp. NC1]
MSRENRIAEIIVRIGVGIIAFGFLFGIVIGASHFEFDLLMALKWWVVSFVTGILFIGFAEVIELLHKIHEKVGLALGKENESNIPVFNDTNPKYRQTEWSLSMEEENSIRNMFNGKILAITETPFQDIVYVELENNAYKILEVGYFTPKEVPFNLLTDELNEWLKEKHKK